jgi:hypothetical protein
VTIARKIGGIQALEPLPKRITLNHAMKYVVTTCLYRLLDDDVIQMVFDMLL